MCAINFNISMGISKPFLKKDDLKDSSSVELKKSNKNNFNLYDAQLANINKARINFKGYYGDIQPAMPQKIRSVIVDLL